MTTPQKDMLTLKYGEKNSAERSDPVLLHGKAIGLLTNTHSNYYIAVFENGNEFIDRSVFEKNMNRYLNTQR